MVDTRITDNIFENSAHQTDALTLAEQVLTFWHFWLPGVTPDECQVRALAASTLRGLIEKERSIPIGTGLERFTELAKGIYSGYIVLMPVSTFGKVIRVDFFHTIQREIVGSLVFEQADGYLRVKVVELKVF